MKIGYARVSKNDGSQKLDLQTDALKAEGVKEEDIYSDLVSGVKADRPGLASCLKALRRGDILIVWSLDRLGRNLKHLINLVEELNGKGVSFKVLNGQGAGIDTSTSHGKFFFQIFGALSEFERELIRERTRAGIAAARARGKRGGRKHKLTKNQVRFAKMAMLNQGTVVSDLCKELKITRATLYRYISPQGQFRSAAEKVLNK